MNPTDRQSFSPLVINGLSRPMSQAIKPYKLTPEISNIKNNKNDNLKESPGGLNKNSKFHDLINIDILNSWDRFKHLFTPRAGIHRKNKYNNNTNNNNNNKLPIGKCLSNKNMMRNINFPNKYLSNEYMNNEKSKKILSNYPNQIFSSNFLKEIANSANMIQKIKEQSTKTPEIIKNPTVTQAFFGDKGPSASDNKLPTYFNFNFNFNHILINRIPEDGDKNKNKNKNKSKNKNKNANDNANKNNDNNNININKNRNFNSNLDLNKQISNVIFEGNKISRPFTRHIQWMQKNNIMLPHSQNFISKIKAPVKPSNEVYSKANIELQKSKPKTASKNNEIRVRSIKVAKNSIDKFEDNPLFEKSFTKNVIEAIDNGHVDIHKQLNFFKQIRSISPIRSEDELSDDNNNIEQIIKDKNKTIDNSNLKEGIIESDSILGVLKVLNYKSTK